MGGGEGRPLADQQIASRLRGTSWWGGGLGLSFPQPFGLSFW